MFPRISNELKIFLILFVIFFVTASGNIDSIDGTTHIALAKKIVTEGKIYFENSEKNAGVLTKNPHDGKYYSVYNFGYALFQIPGIVSSILIRDILHSSSLLPRFPFEVDWIVIFYANMLNAIFVALIGIMIYLLSHELYPNNKKISFLIIPLLVLSTNLFIQAHNQFAHPSFTFFFLFSFYSLLRYIKTKKIKYLFFFSLLFAITASVYNATFVLLIPPLMLYYILETKKQKIFSVKNLCIFLICFIPSLLVQLGWNYMRFQNIFSTGYFEYGIKIYDLNIGTFLRNIYGMTFGPNKGLFIYNPILCFSFLSLLIGKKRKQNFNFFLFYLVLTVVYIFNYSLSVQWHGDSVFGPRYLTPLIPIGILLILGIWNELASHKVLGKIKYVLILLGFLVQIPGLMLPNFTFFFFSSPYCQ